MSRTTRSGAVVLSLLCLFLLQVQAASADHDGEPSAAAPNTGDRYQEVPKDPADLLPGYRAGVTYKEPSPNLCKGNVQNPHASRHMPGTISAKVTTDCRGYVGTLSVSGQMWENRWWGFDRVGTPASSAINQAIYVQAVPWVECRTNVMRATAHHESFENGRVYFVDLENVQHVSC